MTSRRRFVIVLAASACIVGAASWVVLSTDRGTGQSPTDDQASTTGAPSGALPTSLPTEAEAATTSGVYGVPTTGAIPTSVPANVATDSRTGPDQGPRVVVTYASWSSSGDELDISAYVSGLVEADGTCAVTATSGSVVRSAAAAAQADATTTVCADLVVPWSRDIGSATVVVTYTSPTTSASSATQTVEVDR